MWDLAPPMAKEACCGRGWSWKVTTRSEDPRSGGVGGGGVGCRGNLAAKWTWLFCGCESLSLVNKNTTGKFYSAGVEDFYFPSLAFVLFEKKIIIIEKRLISPFFFSFPHEIQKKKTSGCCVHIQHWALVFSILTNIFKQTCQTNIRYFTAWA